MSSEDARRVLEALKAIKPSQAAIGSGYGVPGGSYGSGISPLVASYNMPGMPYGDRVYGTALPRDPREFLSGMFSPLAPIQPVSVDQPQPGFDRPQPRGFEYQPSWNMPIGVPGSEGLKLASFANLRSIADIYSVARACIKLRIQEILGLEWDIIPTKDAEKNMRGSDTKHKDFQERRAKAMNFWRNPDPNYGSFESWLSAILEDVLVIDALSLYLHPSRMRGKGLLGSDVAAVEVIAGETIRPLLDVSGGRPKPPNPAYQQFLFGVPRSDLMTVINNEDLSDGMTESMVAEYRGDQLMYLPYFRRSWTPYGFSNLEQALIPAMMGIQRQSWQLDTYSEGCYDDSTEILTRDGWKLFEKLSDVDEVATRSESGEFQWQRPAERQKFRFDGDMVEFKNGTVDLLVTPNHRMLVKRLRNRSRGSNDWHIRDAGTFLDRPTAQFVIPATSRWEGSAPREFVLPGTAANRRHPAWERAVAWLSSYLVEDETPAAQVLADAKAAGVSEKGLQAARKLMGITSRRDGYTGFWYWHLPAREAILPTGNYVPTPELRIPMADWCVFLGLFLAEGWVRKDRSDIIIAQAPTSRHLPEIKEILSASGVNWSYDAKHWKFVLSHKGLADYLRANTGNRAWGKHLPDGTLDLAPHLLERLLRGMMIGDGHWGKIGQRYLTTTSPVLADQVQELFQKIGATAWIQYYDPQPGSKSVRRTYVVRERMNATPMLPRPGAREYHGDVYCVSVPNGIVYVRRNNQAVWCGNSVPAVFISAGDQNATPNQLRELQDALNAMAGDPAWKHKIIVLPGGSKIDPMKPQALADAFDEIMMTQMCMAFDVMPLELGISPKVSTTQSPGAANQMAKASEKVNQRKALRPLLKWLKASVFDFVMQKVCGQHDMQFMWEGLEEGVDEESQVGLLIQEISFGLRSIDEARIQRGEQPWGLPMTSDPVYATPNGLMPIGSIDPNTGMPAALQPEVAPGSALPGNTAPNGAMAGTTPSGNPSTARTVKPGKPNRLPTASVPGPKAKPKPAGNAAPSQKPTAAATGPRVSPSHTARGSASKREKVTKESVNYREGSNARHCGNCSMYADHTCTLVEGYIAPSMLCDEWDPRHDRADKGFDTRAALKELDLIRRQLRKDRSITDWQVKDLPQQVMAELRADLYSMDATEAVMKARDGVYKLAQQRVGAGTADREAAIEHIQSRVATDLRSLCNSVENGKLSTADFLSRATDVMRGGIRAGLQAGAYAAVGQARAEKRLALRLHGETWTNIVKDDDDQPDGYSDVLDSGTPYGDYLDTVADQQAQEQSGYLSGLLQDILAAFGIKDWLDSLTGRLNLYAAQVRSAYEQGYGTTYAAMNAPGSVIYTWYTTSSKPCKLCAAREGQQYTEDQLPGFPGQGGFGAQITGSEVGICEGGPNCKCYLSATTVPDGTGSGGFFKAARAAFSASLKAVLGKAQAEEITQHDHGYHTHPDETHHVYAYLARHYPSDVLGWVKSARWRGPVEVKLKDIVFERRPGGPRNQPKVDAIAYGIDDGHKIDPVVLVQTPDSPPYRVADGYHRLAALHKLGVKKVSAWVGEVDVDSGDWGKRMNQAKLNKSADD